MNNDADGNQRSSTPRDANRRSSTNQESAMSLLMGECLCATGADEVPEGFSDVDSSLPLSVQSLELNGVECISLGSTLSELSARERVEQEVNRLSSHTEMLISIGYVGEKGNYEEDSVDGGITEIRIRDTETVPLEICGESSVENDILSIITDLKAKDFVSALAKLEESLNMQRSNTDILGLTLHNIGVVNIWMGKYEVATEMFHKAIEAKKAAFGDGHQQVAKSLNELGIQYFAEGKFQEALVAFEQVKEIRIEKLGEDHPKVALTTNNIGCVIFLMDQPEMALSILREGKDLLRSVMGSSATVKLDLLHLATASCNHGYIESRLKNYDEARATYEEALLVQQSVLGDNHDTVKVTLSNIAFTNAFHS